MEDVFVIIDTTSRMELATSLIRSTILMSKFNLLR